MTGHGGKTGGVIVLMWSHHGGSIGVSWWWHGGIGIYAQVWTVQARSVAANFSCLGRISLLLLTMLALQRGKMAAQEVVSAAY